MATRQPFFVMTIEDMIEHLDKIDVEALVANTSEDDDVVEAPSYKQYMEESYLKKLYGKNDE